MMRYGMGGVGDIRFTPESGRVRCTGSCPLWAITDQILRRSEIPLGANRGRTELSTFASQSFAPEAKVGVEPYKQ